LVSVILALPSGRPPPGPFVTVVLAIPCFGNSLAIRKGTKEELLMAEAADQAQHDFWRPPMAVSEVVVHRGRSDERSATCHRCGTEFIVGSVYCHACGASRPGLNAARTLEIPGFAELASLGERLGLTTPAIIAFLVGVLCVVGALLVSVFFSVRTALDWQAIQLWRIEWLLAAIASFVAGCLLKK
jgi:hypothetical protein